MIKNYIKTTMLLGVLAGLLVFIARALGGTGALYPALMAAGFITFFSFFFSSSMVLAVHGARPFKPEDHPILFSMIQELATTMNLPMPRVYYVPTKVANAFATGRNPSNATLGITDGILQILDAHELRGVLAHELAHVQNRDTLLMAVASTMAIAIGYLANMARYITIFRPPSRDNDRDAGPSVLSLFVIIMLMPLAAALVRLAISRNREFVADETGALASDDPLALASALEKLNHNRKYAHFPSYDMARASTAPLFIVNPLWGSRSLTSLFSTHPSVEERIKRLRRIYEQMFNH